MMKQILIALYFLCVSTVYAQVPHFQSYNVLGKKNPVQVNALLQDKRGYLWLGTNKGLFRYNGLQFVQFSNTENLPAKEVTAIAEDSTGTIWTGHQNGQMAMLRGNKVTLFEPEEGNSPEAISDILFDRKGTLWFGTQNDGLYFFKGNRLYRADDADGMPDLYIYDIVEDDNGRIIVGTDGGVAICTLEGNKIMVETIDDTKGLPDNIVRKLVVDDNQLWMGSEDEGVFSVNTDSGKITRLFEEWHSGSVTDLLITDRYLWIVTSGSGILLYDRTSDKSTWVEEYAGYSLHGFSRLLQDVEGNVWLGGRSGLVRSSGTGVMRIQPRVADHNVLAITTGGNGDLWYSTKQGLVRELSATKAVVKPLEGSRFEGLTVISLYTDPQGYIWAGLYGEGILRIDPQTHRIEHWLRELVNGNALSITGSGNVIWVATLGGAAKITTGKDNKVKIENINTEKGLSSDFIYQVFIDSKNRTWFATDGKGVDMMDENGFHHYEDGLPSKVIYGFAEDGKGGIWLNVQANGLYTFDGKKGFGLPAYCTNISQREFQSIKTDLDGNIVGFHEQGFAIINPRLQEVRTIADESGISEMIPNLNAAHRNGEGQLFFGTNDGIVQYQNAKDLFAADPLPIIESVQFHNEKLNLTTDKELRYNQNDLIFHFSGLWYKNPDQVYYSYKLDDFDMDWIVTKNKQVRYPRLPPGDYTFKVRVSTAEDFSNAKIESISFRITPPFWRTTTFYILLVLALALSGYGIVKFRERKLLTDKIILEAQVKRRTIEIQRQNNEIQAQNEEIMAQAEEIKGINENLEQLVIDRTAELNRKNLALEEYAFINAHKLRSPVASVLGLINLLSRAELNDEATEISNRLKQSAEELDQIVRSITKAIEDGETLTDRHLRRK